MSNHLRFRFQALLVISVLLAAFTAGPLSATTFTTLYSFSSPPATLVGTPLRDSAGNLFAVAQSGGGDNCGAVIEAPSTGGLSVLYTFSGSDGCQPAGGLVRDATGNFYGATTYGGAYGYGTIFKLDAVTNNVATLHSFNGSDGQNPNGSLIFDGSGNLVGTTANGGDGGSGTLFSLTPSGVLSTLWFFYSTATGGDNPAAGVVMDSSGSLYGTAQYGGANGLGTIWSYSQGSGLTVLHAFSGSDGSEPASGLIRTSGGTLYGTTTGGGASGNGTAFSLAGGNLTVLHSFDGTDGARPAAELYRDANGNLFGTTSQAGPQGFDGGGTIFEITSGRIFLLLASPGDGATGYFPISGVVPDGSGDFYYTTQSGPARGYGTIARVDSAGNISMVTAMTNSTGSSPAGIVRDASGNLIGATSFGGGSGTGTLYRLNTSNQLTVLHDFAASDGSLSQAPPAIDPSGNIIGTAPFGGGFSDSGCFTTGCGSVFERLTGGQFGVLRHLGDGSYPSDAHHAWGAPAVDSSGNIYGTSHDGGGVNNGTIFKIDPSANFTILHSFIGSEGTGPYSGVILDSAGNKYGTASGGGANGYGSLYKLDPTGALTVLHSFNYADGSDPGESLVRDAAGNLYGTTQYGGAQSDGTIFKLDPNMNFYTLHDFTGPDGDTPYGFLVRDGSGNLYGTTQYGGAYNCGEVWKFDTRRNLTVLHTFNGADGCSPGAGVVLDGSGNLYGTTFREGSGGGGTIFKIAP